MRKDLKEREGKGEREKDTDFNGDQRLHSPVVSWLPARSEAAATYEGAGKEVGGRRRQPRPELLLVLQQPGQKAGRPDSNSAAARSKHHPLSFPPFIASPAESLAAPRTLLAAAVAYAAPYRGDRRTEASLEGRFSNCTAPRTKTFAYSFISFF